MWSAKLCCHKSTKITTLKCTNDNILPSFCPLIRRSIKASSCGEGCWGWEDGGSWSQDRDCSEQLKRVLAWSKIDCIRMFYGFHLAWRKTFYAVALAGTSQWLAKRTSVGLSTGHPTVAPSILWISDIVSMMLSLPMLDLLCWSFFLVGFWSYAGAVNGLSDVLLDL